MLSNIEVLSNSLPTIDDLVPMTMAVGYKAIHEFILQNAKSKLWLSRKNTNLEATPPKLINFLKFINLGGVASQSKFFFVKANVLLCNQQPLS